MNKLEYIPGDIVKIEYGEATGKIGFVTNTFLRRKGFYSLVVFIGKGFQGSFKDDWIQTYNDGVSPIPLTPEILEKNGWKPTKESLGHSFKNTKYPRFALWSINDKWNFTIDGVMVCNTLSCLCYVHELQHLLFGLGINSEMEV